MTESQALTKRVENVRDLLESRKGEFAAALPQHMNATTMLRIAVTSIRKNPRLAEADPSSLYGAVMEAAQCGLYLDGVLGEASLLPFWNSKRKTYEVVFVPGYRGLVKLAIQSGKVRDVSAHTVYTDEAFTYSEGEAGTLHHVPGPPGEDRERLGAYSRVTYTDGTTSVNWMWAKEIIAIRDKSPAARKKQGPWYGTEFEQNEMWKKTAFRNHSKWLNLSRELTKAAVLDEMYDAGISQRNLGPEPGVYMGDPEIGMPEPEPEGETVEGEVVEEGDQEEKDSKKKSGKKTKKDEDFKLESQAVDKAFELSAKIIEFGEVLGKKREDIDKDIAECDEDLEQLSILLSHYKGQLQHDKEKKS